ncbi:MAG: V-type ATPase 116kDa subunit family protein [Deinococcota bacterium]
MIAEMDKLLVVGRRSEADKVLSFLQDLGVVQLDPVSADVLGSFELTGDVQASKETQDRLLAESQMLLDSLSLTGLNASQVAAPDIAKQSADAQLAYLEGVSSKVDALLRERGEASETLETIKTYLPVMKQLESSLGLLGDSRYLRALPFIIGRDALSELETAFAEDDNVQAELVVQPYSKDYLVLAVTLNTRVEALQGLLTRLGIGILELPKAASGTSLSDQLVTMAGQQESLPKRIGEIRSELDALASEHAAAIHWIYNQALDQRHRYDAMNNLAAGNYSFALEGWLPTTNTTSVISALNETFGDGIVIETRHADAILDHGVPVKLENPAWIQPFEGLLSLFAPPKYDAFDPSWTLAVFFPFYFGLVVGDIGFGILFVVLGQWFRRRGKNGNSLDLGPLGIILSPGALPIIGTVINWCAAWSIVFGVLFGEFFGNFLERFPSFLPIFYAPMHAHHHEGLAGLIPIALLRVEIFTPLLLASIAFGVLQVLGGWGIRAYYAYRHYNSHHLWESIGMLAGLAAIVVFSYGFLTNNLNTFVGAFVLLGFIIFLFAVVMSGVPLMLVEIISNSGNILSYLRLFAVGLSAALVANLATDLGFAVAGTLPVIGPLLGIAVGLAVHMIALTLTIIGHTLQPLRLQYVEFFTKFGFYEENGRPYKPLRFFGGKA